MTIFGRRFDSPRRHLQRTALRGPILEVTSGLHRGLTVALQERSYRIGSDASADIVLQDADVAAEHALFRIESGRLRLQALAGDVGLAGGLLSKGSGWCHVRLPTEFMLAGVKVRVIVRGRPPNPVMAVREPAEPMGDDPGSDHPTTHPIGDSTDRRPGMVGGWTQPGWK